MKISIDGRAIYNLISGLSRKDDGDLWTETATKKFLNAQIGFPPARMPLPFGSIDGQIQVVGENYSGRIDLNPPELVDINALARRRVGFFRKILEKSKMMYRLGQVEDCIDGIGDRLEKQYGQRYVKIGQGLDGYLLDTDGTNRAAITRDLASGILRVQVGGNSVSKKRFDAIESFSADMELLSEDINLILNAGLEEAVQRGLIASKPEATIRLSPN